jgi:hypothetical protein
MQSNIYSFNFNNFLICKAIKNNNNVANIEVIFKAEITPKLIISLFIVNAPANGRELSIAL